MNFAVSFDQENEVYFKESDEHIIITGATGWLGQAFLEAFTHALGETHKERLHAFASREKNIRLENDIIINVLALEKIHFLSPKYRYWLLHLAFLTKDKQNEMSFADYVEGNLFIRKNVEKVIKQLNINALCIASSGAVYTCSNSLQRDRGFCAYSALKVEDEEYFGQVCKAKEIPLVIPRIFNMSGPYINKWDAYAISNLLIMAHSAKEITINATHPVIRSYCYITDIINVIIHSLLSAREKKLEFTYDICMDETVEIGKLAEYICNIVGRDKNAIKRTYNPNAKANLYVGNSDNFLKLCRKHKIFPISLTAQIKATDFYIRNKIKKMDNYILA